MAGEEYEGEGKDLNAALDDAWKKAKDKHGSGSWFVVDRIEVQGTNPLSDYRVILRAK